MRKVFKDKTLEKEFQKQGFVQIPLLSQEEVAHLWDEFHRTFQMSKGKIGSGENDFNIDDFVSYDFTFIDKNPDYKKKVFQIIDDVFKPKYDKILDDFKPIIANYIRKQNKKGEVPLHQNWAFVDEKKYTSVSIWCPLVDSNRENGTLEVLPNSHKKFGQFRGPMIPWECQEIQNEIIDNYLIPLNTKAGDAVVIDDSIIHYSRPNNSENLRIAIQLILIPKEAPSVHYHLDEANNPDLIDVFEVDWEFYMNFHPWFKPKGVKKIKSISYQKATLNRPTFDKKLKGKRFDKSIFSFQF